MSEARKLDSYRSARRNLLRSMRKDPSLRKARGKKLPWREGWALIQRRFSNEEGRKSLQKKESGGQ